MLWKEHIIGCTYKEALTRAKDQLNGKKVNDHKCAFCRQQTPKNKVKATKKLMKKKNAQAYLQMADYYRGGTDGVFQSDTKSLEFIICAAELDHPEAFVNIGRFYENGIIVEFDMSKAIEYYEIAAKKGSIYAHQKLAFYSEDDSEENQTCIKHLKVAARLAS